MCQAVVVTIDDDRGNDPGIDPGIEMKRAAINAAAIDQFSQRGFAGTSMANIADAAGMSRPALYQHFRNKGDIFASAFVALFDDCVDRALAALEAADDVATQLDELLQRFYGDLWERTAASPHSDEILSAKHDHASNEVAAVVDRLWASVGSYLAKQLPGRSAATVARRTGWLDLLRLSPHGFKADQPDVAIYRQRLTVLANGVAADIATR